MYQTDAFTHYSHTQVQVAFALTQLDATAKNMLMLFLISPFQS